MLREADRARQVQYAPAPAETRGVAARDVIAIVFDFDDTALPDSTSQLLERHVDVRTPDPTVDFERVTRRASRRRSS